MTTTKQIAVITGSVRQDRFGSTVTAWLDRQISSRGGIGVDHIDLADEDFPDDMGAGADVFGKRIAAAGAVLIVTPEYNHSFPGPLKKSIDSLRDEWKAKPVGFVSYGGIGGGLRAVEALRLVFAELHAVTVRDTVSFHNPWGDFDAAGNASSDEVSRGALDQLLNQLEWWSGAVNNRLETQAYPA